MRAVTLWQSCAESSDALLRGSAKTARDQCQAHRSPVIVGSSARRRSLSVRFGGICERLGHAVADVCSGDQVLDLGPHDRELGRSQFLHAAIIKRVPWGKVKNKPGGAATAPPGACLAEFPEQPVVTGALCVRLDPVGVEQQLLPAGSVVPPGTPRGNGQIGPAVSDPKVAEVDMA